MQIPRQTGFLIVFDFWALRISVCAYKDFIRKSRFVIFWFYNYNIRFDGDNYGNYK